MLPNLMPRDERIAAFARRWRGAETRLTTIAECGVCGWLEWRGGGMNWGRHARDGRKERLVSADDRPPSRRQASGAVEPRGTESDGGQQAG